MDMVVDTIADLHQQFTNLSYNTENLKHDTEIYSSRLPPNLLRFVQVLGSKKYLFGDTITFPDFVFFVELNANLRLLPNCLDEYPTLQEYVNNFSKIEQLSEYISSDVFQSTHLNNMSAKYRG
eukprot:TRINITY_DN2769_c0_g1_i2.p1 TRINITY_DN2769_c0_g1~~TRINITY_DN2769_c0_g1_i2.p1  ORF type:complete len:123 (-),score=13.85 TRINITY_DN2769_c0_g1_i2:20-388(-)